MKMHYVDEFITLKCAPDLLIHRGLFPNIKEISESMAAFHAVRNILGTRQFGNNDIALYDVCCGHMPRTAALFAHMTKWRCIAIDPLLRDRTSLKRINRLSCFTSKLEDMPCDHLTSFFPIVIIAVHPHISTDSIVKTFAAPMITLITMECCFSTELLDTGRYEIIAQSMYDDTSCLSNKNLMRCWQLRRKQST